MPWIPRGSFRGPIGKTPKLTATVADGAPGSSATVEQTGTDEAPVLKLTIPKGRDGSNVLPTDQAVSDAITTPGSPANTALTATIAGEVGPVRAASGIAVRAAVWSNGGATGTDANFTDIVQRIPITLPVNTTRWRLRIRNADQYGAGIAGAFTIVRPSLGIHAIDANGAGTGEMTGAPHQLGIDTLAINSDGTEWTGAWVTATAGQFTAQTQHLLSIGLRMSAGQTTIKTNSVSWYRSGTSHLANTQTIGSLIKSNPFLDIRVEYEYDGVEPAMAVGDSITDGLFAGGKGQIGGYPATLALRTGQPVNNAAVSGHRANQVKGYGTTHWYWTRVIPLGGTAPKAAIVSLGTNDAVTVGETAATIKTNLLTIFATLRSLGVKRLYASTIAPREDAGATVDVKAIIAEVNAWLLTRPAGLVDVFEFDRAVGTAVDPADLDERYDSGDGLHLNTAGYARLARAIPGRL